MILYTAPISKRVFSAALDFVFVFMGMFILSVCLVAIAEVYNKEWLSTLMIVGLILFILFYVPFCETFFNGQTLGKKIIGIKVVRDDGAPVSGVESMQRFLMLFFDLVATSGMGGLISAIVSDKNQRLGDILAGTLVVVASPHSNMFYHLYDLKNTAMSEKESRVLNSINPYANLEKGYTPTEMAYSYRRIESDLAMLNTSKGDNRLIQYLETLLSSMHLAMFRRKGYTWSEMCFFALRSIPTAVYEARMAILGSLVIAVIAYAIGWYAQSSDIDYFYKIFGENYKDITDANIAENNPMGIYQQDSPFAMFASIFINNLVVTLKVYIFGIFTLIGPLYMLLVNFISFGSFDAYFAQHGLLADALISPMEHGTLELSSIIIAGGASIRLGTGWLFPGELTRLAAFGRGARQSVLILLSTLPMILIAAIIESFVTRHYEWSVVSKLTIIIVSFFIILGYYVMLPIIARRLRRDP